MSGWGEVGIKVGIKVGSARPRVRCVCQYLLEMEHEVPVLPGLLDELRHLRVVGLPCRLELVPCDRRMRVRAACRVVRVNLIWAK